LTLLLTEQNNFDKLYPARSQGGGMSQNQAEEAGKQYYLMQNGHICGSFIIIEDNDIYIAFYQENPFGNAVPMDDMERKGSEESYLKFISDHARSLFVDVCTYFGRRGYAVQTDPSAITDEQYRQSMWEMFKNKKIPPDVYAELMKRVKALLSNKDSETGARLEIGVFYIMSPSVNKKSLIDQWEKWFNAWYPDN